MIVIEKNDSEYKIMMEYYTEYYSELINFKQPFKLILTNQLMHFWHITRLKPRTDKDK